ncbi:T-cell surface glycoprotein CD3 epsilon chain [Zootoca vivipara]|uniref:T-cell surface glycoprotein CD3 epsilon chain n=1 Tax=Zootoca vivipara TaxID=8524 RepID=UPI00159005F8|nr:T-cell surface glycoprotein CD3 epsilon chain [Zootoca vivipara]
MHLGVCLGAFVLVLPLSSSSESHKVDISGRRVTVTCPLQNAKWDEDDKMNGNHHVTRENETLTIEAMNDNEVVKGDFTCQDGKTSNKIYLQIKACDDCVDLSIGLVAGIIVADLLITLGIMFLVYYCRSKKPATSFGGGAAGGGTRGRTRGQKVDRPPPVPNPDYEPIRKGQREVYAGLEPRAF